MEKYDDIDNKFKKIENVLNEELIGQSLYIDKLIKYFKGKVENNEKGVLLLAGQKDTGKKLV